MTYVSGDQSVHVDGGVVAPAGFTAAGVSCGLKPNGAKDLALVVAPRPVSAAAVFTTNAVAAAPVRVSRRHIASGRCRAVVINAGNANACTPGGEDAAETVAEKVASALASEITDVIVCSTGVIGVPLPVDKVVAGVDVAVAALDDHSGGDAAAAIMTTDTFAKQSAVSVALQDGRTITVGGMAKGSGMIAPNMATMLGVLTTDAPLTPRACDMALKAAVDVTFNRVTVDSDTSTNDTVVLMASGETGGEPIDIDSPHFGPVAAAIHQVSMDLARMLAKDGEGATKLITVIVGGARSEEDAEKAARAIADSPLVKTAVFGKDANWGRVAMAAGKSGAHLDPDRLGIVFAGVEVCRDGAALPFDEGAALSALSADEITIACDLGVGAATANIFTCDLSYEYVRINGEYRS